MIDMYLMCSHSNAVKPLIICDATQVVVLLALCAITLESVLQASRSAVHVQLLVSCQQPKRWRSLLLPLLCN